MKHADQEIHQIFGLQGRRCSAADKHRIGMECFRQPLQLNLQRANVQRYVIPLIGRQLVEIAISASGDTERNVDVQTSHIDGLPVIYYS